MKILFIIPGSGDSFYCSNCLRDTLYADTLRRAGHDVIVLPLYLPPQGMSVEVSPLFFSAVSFYVACTLNGKKALPKWLMKLLETKPILKIAASLSGTTSSKGLETMTLSMINGVGEAFEKEVESLIEWIEHHECPDVIHLSTSMLIGIAKSIKQRLSIPIVCSLKDEEMWLDKMAAKYIPFAWKGIEENVKYVDKFVTVSQFYREYVQKRIPAITDVDVIYSGVHLEQYQSDQYPINPTVGFFDRMCYENGLDILAEAFVLLKQKNSIPDLKLKIAGGYTGEDTAFLKKVKRILASVDSDVEFISNYDAQQHETFFKQISVLSVPLRINEGIGLYVCQAYAAGRPVIMPKTGSFPEIVMNGGVLYEPNTPQQLAIAIEELLNDKEKYSECRKNALKLSKERYDGKLQLHSLEELYRGFIRK